MNKHSFLNKAQMNSIKKEKGTIPFVYMEK
jgi:hypothetical protein